MPTILFCGYLYVFKGKFKYLSGNKKGLKWPFLLSLLYSLVYGLARFVKKLAALL